MCARFTIRRMQDIARTMRAEIIEAELTRARYNIAPTQNIPALYIRDRRRVLSDCRWGLVPSWARDPSLGARMINARAETLADKPAFRKAFRSRRCLIPADGFYEWQATDTGKQPYYFQLQEGALFMFAGLYEVWHSPGSAPLRTCTLITTAANEQVQPIHDRMPVILPERDHDAWLDPEQADTHALRAMLRPFDAGTLDVRPVTRYVNAPTHDDERCIETA